MFIYINIYNNNNNNNKQICVVNMKALKTISTTLPIEAYNEIKQARYAFNELILLGLLSKKNNPQMIARMGEMERENARLIRKIQELGVKLNTFEELFAAQAQKKPLQNGAFSNKTGVF